LKNIQGVIKMDLKTKVKILEERIEKLQEDVEDLQKVNCAKAAKAIGKLPI
jgi:hypothetical protein